MNTEEGFTVIELVAVIMIIAILMAIMIPTISYVSWKNRQIACMANLVKFGMQLEIDGVSIDFTVAEPEVCNARLEKNPVFYHSSSQGGIHRAFAPGSSYITVNFQPGAMSDVTLGVCHLSSGSSKAPGDGYSPVDVVVNDIDDNPFNETELLLDNYDVATAYEGSHSFEWDEFSVPSDMLKNGVNTITIALEDEPWAYTHYWIKGMWIVSGKVGNCPATRSDQFSYIFVPAWRQRDGGLMIGCDRKDNHRGKGRNVFFNDGSVRWMKETLFQENVEDQADSSPIYVFKDM
jgi:prepilin-type N-terminal cleavage/methylation domain-containing protein